MFIDFNEKAHKILYKVNPHLTKILMICLLPLFSQYPYCLHLGVCHKNILLEEQISLTLGEIALAFETIPLSRSTP